MNTRTIALVLAAGMLLSIAGMATAQDQTHEENGAQSVATDEDSGYSGEPVEVTMYHHVYNLLDKVPMNTQSMDAAAPGVARGYSTPTVVTPAASNGASFNEMYMYNSPGPVHYNVSLGQPKYHPERGLAEDLDLDNSKEIMVYWYLAAEAGQTPAGSTPVGGTIPELTVRATLRLGDNVGGDLDAGQIVAQGEWVGELATSPGGPPTEIPINLGTPKMATIPKDESFNLKVEWFQLSDNGVEYADNWALYSGAEFPNRMVWTIKNPVRINYIHPQFIGDRKLVIHAAFNSPFGNYDVDVDPANPTELNNALKIIGPNGDEIQPKSIQGPIIVQKSWVHNHHFEPVLATWVWNYKEDGAPEGQYQVELDVSNFQQSANAAKQGLFSVLKDGKAGEAISSAGETIAPQAADGETNDSPTPVVLMPLALIAGAIVAARRRRDDAQR